MKRPLKRSIALVLLLMGMATWYGPAQAASLALDQTFRAPLFTQPNPAARTLLLADGKYLLFFGTDTLTDRRTGALTRYLADGTLDLSFNFSREYNDVSAVAVTTAGRLIVAVTQYTYGVAETQIIRLQADGSIDSPLPRSTSRPAPHR